MEGLRLRRKRVGMEGLKLRQGTWWFQKPNGTWMRYKPGKDPGKDQWVPTSKLPPPPPRCEDVATQRRPSVEDFSNADLELLKSVVDQHRFVTNMFWQQANFFTVIQSALLSVVAALFIKKGADHPMTFLLLSILGMGLAVFWGLIALNRVRIIDEWNKRVEHLDEEVDRHRVYKSVKRAIEGDEKKWYKPPIWYIPPTHMTRFLPWLLALAWIVPLIWSIGALN